MWVFSHAESSTDIRKPNFRNRVHHAISVQTFSEQDSRRARDESQMSDVPVNDELVEQFEMWRKALIELGIPIREWQ